MGSESISKDHSARRRSEALTTLDELLDQSPARAKKFCRWPGLPARSPTANSIANWLNLQSSPPAHSPAMKISRRPVMRISAWQNCSSPTKAPSASRSTSVLASRQTASRRRRDYFSWSQLLAGSPASNPLLPPSAVLPPTHYTEEDWQIVQACFTLLRHAAGQLQVVFAESGTVDYTEVAQIAQRVLKGEDGLPTDAALRRSRRHSPLAGR